MNLQKNKQMKEFVTWSEDPSIATVDLVRSLNGEQHFFTDHLQLDSFKRDPEIAAAVKTLRLELEQNTPQQGITIGGLS